MTRSKYLTTYHYKCKHDGTIFDKYPEAKTQLSTNNPERVICPLCYRTMDLVRAE